MLTTNTLDKVILVLQRKQKALAIVTSIVLFSLMAYYTYTYYSEKYIQNASLSYYKILADKDYTLEQRMQAYQTISKDYSTTIYAQLSQIKLAKIAVDNKDYDKAIKYYQEALSTCKVKELKHLISTRLAKVYILNKQPELAQQILTTINDSKYLAVKNIIMTDVLIAQNRKEEAKKLAQETITNIAEANNNEDKHTLEILNQKIKTIEKDDKK